MDYAYASQYSLPPIQLLSMLLPDFFVVNGQYWGLWSRWEVFAYVGIAPLLLALYGVVLARSRLVFFFVGLGLFSLAVALGEHSGGCTGRCPACPGSRCCAPRGASCSCSRCAWRCWRRSGRTPCAGSWAPPETGTVRQVTLSALLAVGQLGAMAASLAVALVAVYVETHKMETVAWLQTHLLRLRGFDSRWATEQVYRFVLAAVDVTQPATLRQLVLLLAVTGLLLLWDRFRVLGGCGRCCWCC